MTVPGAVTVVDLSASSSESDELAAATHIGPVRNENQDVFAATPMRGGDGVALLVADGMGGMPGGGEAAAAAAKAAIDVLAAGVPDRETVDTAVRAATRAVAALRDQLGGRPGTTLTIAAVASQSAVVAHVGDTRAYLVHGGRAEPLTSDHSWVGDQVRTGALEPGAERRHPRRNIITRAVMGDDVDPELVTVDLLGGDVLLLCSDGFWEPLDDEMIETLLATPGPLTAVVERAAQAALDAGAADNVTVVALRTRP